MVSTADFSRRASTIKAWDFASLPEVFFFLLSSSSSLFIIPALSYLSPMPMEEDFRADERLPSQSCLLMQTTSFGGGRCGGRREGAVG